MKHIISHNNINLEVFSSLKSGPPKAQFLDWCNNLCQSFSFYLKKSVLYGKNLHNRRMKNTLALSLHLCADSKMKSLNSKYRKINKTTDVLSFPLHLDLYKSKEKMFFAVDHLGDIFISYPRVKLQAKDFLITVEDEFYHLAAHGLLHLLGFDHERSMLEEKLMKEEEKKILRKISKLKKGG